MSAQRLEDIYEMQILFIQFVTNTRGGNNTLVPKIVFSTLTIIITSVVSTENLDFC